MGYTCIQHPMTPIQEVLLAWGQILLWPPNLTYQDNITAIELVCQSLNTTETEELRADIYRAIRYSHPPKPNLSKEEWKAMKQLKTD